MSSFYKMDPSAWDFGTANLSLEEEAAYLRIVNAIHKHDAPVPNNDRVLAGLFRCSTRKARALVDALVSAGKVTVEDGVLWNERAREDMAQRAIASASAAERGAKGGKARAKKQATSAQFATISPPVHDHFATISTPEMVTNSARTANEPHSNSLKDSSASQAMASSRIEENRREEIEEEDPRSSASSPSFPREQTTPVQSGDSDLRQRVMAACAAPEHPCTAHWMPPAASIHVHHWVSDLGLTEAEVIAVAMAERDRHRDKDPPSGPRALDRAMQALAAAKSAPTMQPSVPRIANGNRSHHQRADAAIVDAKRAFDEGAIDSLIAGPYAPGASRRR